MIGTTISHYKILEKLGEGGMGVVYKAQDTKLDRFVALKFLPAHITVDEAERSRFFQEARSAAVLNHPNICTVYGIHDEGGQPFIEMELVDGKTIRSLNLASAKIETSIGYAIQIGDALQEAHSRGIVHRDIKADNIMVNSKNQVKVMDFGLAKIKGSLKLTRTSSTVGTIGYMAPEQIQGGEVDARSDIFAFGALLFEMLTGRLPFRGEHEAAMMYSILNEDPELLQKYRTDLPEELQRIISRSLEKDSEDRYQSAADMVSELRRIQKKTGHVSRVNPVSSTIPAQPPSTSISTSGVPAISRRTLYVAGALAVLLIGMILSYVLFRSSSGSDRKSIAVLPFKDLNSGEDSEFFSDGISEDIINQLSRIHDLRVMSRPAVMRYKKSEKTLREIGKELNVGTILTGTVRRVGDQLRISAALIDASSEQQIWGDAYEKKTTQVFEIQTAVARQVASSLQTNLSPDEVKSVSKQQTGNIEAYTFYLKGRDYYYRYHREDNENAIKLFKKALELDPHYALAYAGLGDAYGQRTQRFGFLSVWIDSSIAAGQKAVDLDPSLAEGYKALALGYQQLGKQALALENYKKSVELNPSYYPAVANIGAAYEAAGRPDEALPWVKKSISINPTNPVTIALLGGIYFDLEQDAKARDFCQRALELQPDLLSGHQGLAVLEFLEGKKEQAQARSVRLIQSIPEEPGPVSLAGIVYFFSRDFSKALPYFEKELAMTTPESGSYNQLAYIYTKLGRTKDSKKMLELNIQETLKWLARGDEGPDSRISLAISYKLQGNNPEAYNWLRESVKAGWNDYRLTPHNPLFDSFREDQEFRQIFDGVNARVTAMKKRALELEKD
jgi:serine/threonine protein kinase/tetratricopeptide (TPR) repeat protein